MADPNWPSYVGMATGIIGAITGISGVIMGFISLRKSNEIKSLDLRLEYRKSINNCASALTRAEELLPYANTSRERVAAAVGNYHSGAMQQWKQQYESDTNKLKELLSKAPSPGDSHHDLTPKQLESKLVEIHKLQNEVGVLLNKYQTALDADDKTREHIRSMH